MRDGYTMRDAAKKLRRDERWLRGVVDGLGAELVYKNGAIWITEEDFRRVKEVHKKRPRFKGRPRAAKVAA